MYPGYDLLLISESPDDESMWDVIPAVVMDTLKTLKKIPEYYNNLDTIVQ